MTPEIEGARCGLTAGEVGFQALLVHGCRERIWRE
jgi:hypothetical protein